MDERLSLRFLARPASEREKGNEQRGMIALSLSFSLERNGNREKKGRRDREREGKRETERNRTTIIIVKTEYLVATTAAVRGGEVVVHAGVMGERGGG